MHAAAGGAGIPPVEALREWRDRVEDGTLKMYLTSRLLRLRRDEGAALADPAAAYRPLRAEGAHGERVFAFARGSGAATRLVLVPRLTVALGEGAPIGVRWGDTRLSTGHSAAEWRCLLSGAVVPAVGEAVAVGTAMAELPVAVLAPTNAG
jgi:maltooligosyltrehalose synthase